MSHNLPQIREFLSCLLLLILIGICWFALNGRVLDASQITFLYRDF